MNKSVISCEQLHKNYHDGESEIQVLKGIDFEIQSGNKIAIIGPSGSGKSTFLHLLGGLDIPSKGRVKIQEESWHDLSEKRRCQIRNKSLGFIYQFHHLLPEFNALENVALPLLLGGISLDESKERAHNILGQVGLHQRETHKPAALSGGERQRVAIARALVHEPKCVLADEPTGNLDHATAMKVFDLMLKINEQLNTALLIVTHDTDLARQMDRQLHLVGGKLRAV